MKRTNLIRKSINLALSVLVAGSIVAVGADGSTMAAVSGNEAIISSVVDAAEVTQIPWSTGYVYQLLPIDLSTGGQGGASDGSSVTMDYTAGSNKDWVARFTTAVTADGQTLQFQYMTPDQFFPLCGQMSGGYGGGYYFCDATQLKNLTVWKDQLKVHPHLWEYTKAELTTEMNSTSTNCGMLWYDSTDEGFYYRTTYNYNSIAADGVTPLTGIASFIEVKATGEIYGFDYSEPTITYNDTLAKEIIYSCAPTKLQ